MVEYKRNCPLCGKEIIHKNKRECVARYLRNTAAKLGSKCKGCSNTGKLISQEGRQKLSILHKGRSCFEGRHHSNITKRKIAEARRGKLHDEQTRLKMASEIKKAMYRPDVRERHIKALAETKYLGKSVDRGQLEMLNKWNGFGFQFEPNYQLYTDNFLCYVDGYDTVHNVVLEYDSKYHKKPSQQQKDLIRQQKIIDILHPKKFWRYDAINRTFSQKI